MDLLNDKTDQELLRSIVAEAAKAKNEINCARKDLAKVESRLDFTLVLANNLIKRKKD